VGSARDNARVLGSRARSQQPEISTDSHIMAFDGEKVNDRCLKIGIQLLKLGYWVVAIHPGEKRPIGEAWGAERWTEDRLRRIFAQYPDAGIGICFGPGRAPGGGWLVDAEGDGEEAGESLAKLLGGECVDVETVSWSSARGSHYLFTADGERLLRALGMAGAKEGSGVKAGVWKLDALPGLELRVGGTKADGVVKQLQSVCPPTPGTDGKPRGWIGNPRDGLGRLPDAACGYLESLAPAPKPQQVVQRRAGSDVESRAVAYLDKCDPAVSGQGGHDTTFGVACRVGPGFDLTPAATLRLIRERYNPRCEPPWTDPELAHKVDDAYKVEPRRGWLLYAERNGHAPSTNGVAHAAPTGRLIILASEVVPRRVEWLWPDRIPIGKLTTFAGWGGLGKSFVTMDLAARISRGGEIPGMAGECFERSRVLILNTEDDPDDTSVPRLIEVGADLAQIGFARSEVLGQFTLADLRTLDLMLGQLGEARLLIIDPATAHLGTANDHKNAELRGLLMPLSLWAMERRIAVVLVTHVNKPQAGKVDAMARVVGSVAWVNAVRAAVMFSKDPDDRTRRLFIPFKSNNAPERKGLAYRITPTDSLARVEWLGEVDTSADEAMELGRKPRKIEAAKWLTDRFREKLRWHSDDLFVAAKEAGISRSAIFEAKKLLDLHACKQEMTLEGEKTWVWWVDANWDGFRDNAETLNQ
jgi:hypothetical protein